MQTVAQRDRVDRLEDWQRINDTPRLGRGNDGIARRERDEPTEQSARRAPQIRCQVFEHGEVTTSDDATEMTGCIQAGIGEPAPLALGPDRCQRLLDLRDRAGCCTRAFDQSLGEARFQQVRSTARGLLDRTVQ
jgi:hypothetical protein